MREKSLGNLFSSNRSAGAKKRLSGNKKLPTRSEKCHGWLTIGSQCRQIFLGMNAFLLQNLYQFFFRDLNVSKNRKQCAFRNVFVGMDRHNCPSAITMFHHQMTGAFLPMFK